MKNKIITGFSIIMMLLLCMSAFGQTQLASFGEGQTDESDLVYDQMVFDGSSAGADLNIIERIFMGQPLSFTNAPAISSSDADVVCKRVPIKDGETWGRILANPVGSTFPGAIDCSPGTYTRLFECPGIDPTKCSDIFKQMWYKDNSNDVLDWDDTYMAARRPFNWMEWCYECKTSDGGNAPPITGDVIAQPKICTPSQDFQCTGENTYRQCNTQGTAFVDSECKSGYACSGNDGRCIEVAQKSSVVADMYGVSIQPSTVSVGEVFEVRGRIKVTGDAKGLVVETGFDFYGQPLVIIEESFHGACGDDLTVGAKFDAKDETVEFILRDKATVAGNREICVGVYEGCGGRRMDYLCRTINVEKAPEKECFSCDGTSLISAKYVECPADKSEVEVDCSGETQEEPSEKIECFFCENSVLKSNEYQESACPQGTSPNQITCKNPSSVFCENHPEDVACTPAGPPVVGDGVTGNTVADVNTAPDDDFFTRKFQEFETLDFALAAGILVIIGFIIMNVVFSKKRRRF